MHARTRAKPKSWICSLDHPPPNDFWDSRRCKVFDWCSCQNTNESCIFSQVETRIIFFIVGFWWRKLVPKRCVYILWFHSQDDTFGLVNGLADRFWCLDIRKSMFKFFHRFGRYVVHRNLLRLLISIRDERVDHSLCHLTRPNEGNFVKYTWCCGWRYWPRCHPPNISTRLLASPTCWRWGRDQTKHDSN